MTTPREPSPEVIERAKRMAAGEEFYVDVPDEEASSNIPSSESPKTESVSESVSESVQEPTRQKSPRKRSLHHGEFVRKEDK